MATEANFAVLKTKDSDDDDEEFDMQQVKNVAPVTAKTALLSVSEVTALDVALKRYQRDGYFAKYLTREVDVNGKYTKIGIGGFGDVFKAKYKPIGPFKESSEWFAIKRMVLNNKTLHVVIKEFKFYSDFPSFDSCLVHPSEFWFEKKDDKDEDLFYLYSRMDLCAENMRDAMRLLRATYGDGNRVANQELAIFNLLMFDELLTIFSRLQNLQRPIMHRDFKPENVLFSEQGIKLCDFGCATVGNAEKVENLKKIAYLPTNAMHTFGIGTDLYQPAEQKGNDSAQRKGNYNYKVDMYALGLTLLEMFYATPPEVEELKRLFEDVTKRRKVPDEFSRRWPKIAEIILNLTEFDAEKRKSARDVKYDVHLLWNDIIGNDKMHVDMNKKIVGASKELQQIVDDWANVIFMMQKSRWSFLDNLGNSTSALFHVENDLPIENKIHLQLQLTNLVTVSVAFLCLEEIQSSSLTMQEIANALKERYEIKFTGQNWYCAISKINPTVAKTIGGETLCIHVGGLVESLKLVSGDLHVVLWRTRELGTGQELLDGVAAKIDDDKKKKSAVDDWINKYLNKLKEIQVQYYKDKEDLIENLIKPIVDTVGIYWNIVVGDFVDTIINDAKTVRKFEVICKNGVRVVVFKESHSDQQIVDHSLIAALHYYGKAFFNFEKIAEHIKLKSRFLISQMMPTFRIGLPVSVAYVRGYISANCAAAHKLYIDSLAFQYSLIIWVQNLNVSYLPIDSSDVISYVRKILEHILSLVPYSVDTINDLKLSTSICDLLQMRYGGSWSCLLGNTNHFQHLIYHNGNYYNFVFGQLEIVVYQPGPICSEDC